MKTPRFSGPFKWSALRQQLLSLREDIQSIQKVAGRNVTIDEHRGKGTLINVERVGLATPTGCPVTGTDTTAVISDVGFPCGCIDLTDWGFPGASISCSDSAVNTTTTVGFQPGPPPFWIADPVSPFTVASYTDSTCGHLYFSSDVNQTLLFFCVDNFITILLYDTLDLFATFYAHGVSIGTVASNELTCGEILSYPFPPVYGGPVAVLGVATGGTILISQP